MEGLLKKTVKLLFNSPLTGILLGGVSFFGLFNPVILNPTYFQWLGGGDPGSAFLGWHFFRGEGWHFPPGVIQNYGTDLGASIVFSDSIPVLALLFKIIAPLLPLHFQYFGPWILLCFSLQGLFGWLLMARFTKAPILKGLGTLFFTCAVIFVARWQFQHFALMGHWLILAAIYLYFKKSGKRDELFWSALLVISVMTHAYLFLMVFGVWLAYLGRKKWVEKALSYKKALVLFFSNVTLILGVLFLLGYFTVPLKSISPADSYGKYSLNLLAPINPMSWSTVLHGYHSYSSDQYEGLNYLGAGVLLLIFLAIYKGLQKKANLLLVKRHWPLLAIAAGFFIFALSPVVTWADKIVFQYNPWILAPLFNGFRASGRFFWLVYYLIIILALAVLVSRSKKTAIAIVLGFAFVLQMKDVHPKIVEVENIFRSNELEEDRLQSDFWQSAAGRYKRVVFVPSQNQAPDYFPLALWAADNGLQINVGSFARVDPGKIRKAEKAMKRDFLKSRPNSGYIYIFSDPAKAEKWLGEEGMKNLGEIDGYQVFVVEDE